jgi:hypothetical protein
MRTIAAIIMLWIASCSLPASAQTTRALFVGIDSYQFSTAKYDNATFKDLRGAVADTIRFKNLLREKYQLDLDRTPQGQCPAAGHPVSITLLNACATRSAILKALNELIDRSGPKDTLLFYFAGHGSQYADQEYTQSSGYNGTILPTDARDPNAEAEGDILDRELRTIKERAVAKGIYFVSIFDSCNSGTATRDGSAGQSRNVPPLRGTPPARPLGPAPTGPGGGYWVHLAAAQDGEQAQEVGTVGKREGVFTTALIETMRAMPAGTFGDIIREVQAKLALSGQNPMAEGSKDGLKARFGAAAAQAITYDAEPSGTVVSLTKAGSLSGITVGSVFALYKSETDAVAPGSKELATATVTKVSDYSAELALNTAPTEPLTQRLVAVKKQHAFGDTRLDVANVMTVAAEKKGVDKALVFTKIANVGSNPQVQIAPVEGKPGQAQLLAPDGTPIGDLGAIEDADFVPRLTRKLEKILRVQMLLALRTEPDKAALALCVDDSDYPATSAACPPPEKRNLRVVAKQASTLVTVENLGDKPRYLYVLGIDPAYGVALIIPPPGAVDSKVERLKAHRVPNDPLVLTSPGVYRFVTLATDERIDASAFEQDGTKARSGTACKSVLEKLLCDANRGKRDPAASKVGNWTATVDTVLVQ